MSLRWRLTLVIGGVVALMVVGASLLAYVSAASELDRQMNEFLLTRSRETEAELDRVAGLPIRTPEDAAFGIGIVNALGRADADIQLLGSDGRVRRISGDLLPVSAADRDIAGRGPDRSIARRVDDVVVDGERYRVVTSSGPFGALMVGRSMTDVEATLAGLRSWLTVVSLSGALVAAVVGWLVARGVLRPISRLAAATQQVAETGRFDADLRVESNDELGGLARNFNTMLSALRASRDQQHRLVRDANHELRTPLTSLRTNLDVLRRRRAQLDGADAGEILEDMDGEIRELSALVEELVNSATEHSTMDAADFVAVDLGEVAGGVADRTARRTGRTVEVIRTAGSQICGDPAALERAIGNLVGNAVKFSPSASPITVEVDSSTITVIDEGPGVPEGEETRIFDRFYRSDATRTLPGSGLGLAIVADVASAHGGTTFARSTGTGSQIGFTLGEITRPSVPLPMVEREEMSRSEQNS